MADDKEIDELPVASAFTGAEKIHVIQGGDSRQATPAQQRTYTLSNINQDMIPDADGARKLGSDPSASGKAWSEAWIDKLGDNNGDKVDGKYIVNGTARAWVVFDGTDTSIDDSFGVTSLTDNGTGDTTVTLTGAFASAHHPISGAGGQASFALWVSLYPGITPTTTTARVATVIYNNGYVDASMVGVVFHGDLA